MIELITFKLEKHEFYYINLKIISTFLNACK
jgi:hypothetical protein